MKIMRKAALCLSVLMAMGLAGCGPSEVEEAPVVVGYLPIIAHLPALVAEDQGYLADLDVELRVFGSSDDLLSALARNEINIATTVAVAPVAARAAAADSDAPQRVRLFSYSATSSDNPFDSLLVAPNSDLEAGQDLEKRSVGVFPGTTAQNILAYWLSQRHDVDPAEINWVPLPPSLQVDALLNNDIDALYTYEPIRTVALANGARQVYGSVIASLLEDAPYGASAVNVNFGASEPALTMKYINAFDQGIKFIRDHPEDARILLRQELGLPEEVAQNCNLEDRLTSSEISLPENVQRLERFLRLLSRMGEVETAVSAEDLVWETGRF